MSGLDAHPLGGGTWLGLTKSGRLAAITNFTEAAPPPLPQGRGLEAYRSRGSLVRDWLKGEGENSGQERVMERYLEGVASRMDEWPGFNLLVGQLHADRAEMGYVSNRSGEIKAEYFSSEKGHGSDGLSNSCLRQPWDKVKLGREKLDKALDDFDKERREGKQRRAAEDQLSLDLFSILEYVVSFSVRASDSVTHPMQSTPRSKATITARQDFARSIQIPPIRLADDAWYATRTATVLLLRRDGTVRWWENDVYVLSPQGSPIRGEELHLQPRYFEWQLQSP